MAMTDTDKAPVFMVRTKHGLSPAGAYDHERLDCVTLGAQVEVIIKQRRSSRHHRLYWSILARVVENTDTYPDSEHLHEAIKIHLGYVRRHRLLDGRMILQADSTAFAAMDQLTFKVFFDKAMQAIAEHVLPGVDPVALVKMGESAN